MGARVWRSGICTHVCASVRRPQVWISGRPRMCVGKLTLNTLARREGLE